MDSQIFKSRPNPCIFKTLLDNICDRENNRYIINNASFKKGIMFNHITEYCSNVEDNYYESKKFYIRRKMTFKYFITVIRQMCRVNDIGYETVTKYNKSTYEIMYLIDPFEDKCLIL
jgi:hypothetical protein